ncbi:protein MOR1-like [Humulus lupulus]|uniref:protein MOR1-like n=1 Tax=Humulus lupulus TaxID=3486 RepID=UPI002B407DC7|nr:protein MOR1-like [Humulus lupulus]
MEKWKEGIHTALRRSVREIGLDVAEQSGEVTRSVSGPVLPRKNYGNADIHVERQLMPRVLACTNGPTDWNEALDIISFGSPEQSVEGMKVVCHELTQATNDPEGSAMDELIKDADRLVSGLANKVALYSVLPCTLVFVSGFCFFFWHYLGFDYELFPIK